MGNCSMSGCRVMAQEEIESDLIGDQPEKEEEEEGDKRVRVRTSAGNDGEADKDDGVVRVRVLVTKGELRRIMSGSEGGIDDLLNALKKVRRRGIAVSGDDERVGAKCWRPALESIPEDHQE
ncbi:hypothetical protein SAY87_020249 [Trapa incisa]|uniref:Uncharacterized protein n=2 Tax=Trapa TaxID=22665 RepID=A0AAN7LUK0_TRANT|nr:hypothetical protein SAY87_020249 [Trapa incisa]KAK4793016.1 hypothetical protein SAY86_023451 [Trapa natans]